MALIVTPGAANADAFATLEAVEAYAEAHGLTDWTEAARSPATDDEAAIRRATAWLSSGFAWKGTKTNGRAQALAWPRADVVDDEDQDVASAEIPAEIVQACCIASAYERANPGGLTPNVVLTERIKREKIDTIETEYASTSSTAEAQRPILTLVLDVISGLLSGGANPLAGTAARI